ncbi:sensor histidine kinase [Corallococcus sicarius]|uniref:histidine kinase n=1 Tax=Corallococcus sicarius TaxID=2316726 RepID=A0A3A8NEW2_9BACT|nr:HAMP domain-containing sensor histidine kinase [Corallococcus sicarius]RKH41920.1 sensor histidine kinase [Corallococcus sicarius]
MTTETNRALEQRVLVLAPIGRDALVTRDVLARAGIVAEPCANLAEVCAKFEEGAGALLLAEEALTVSGLALLSRAVGAQCPWSDVPIIISTGAGETTAARVRAVSSLEPSGNVTILERPVRVFTMVTAVQSALRGRARQFQMRDLHLQVQRQMESLTAERELRARFVSLLAHDLRGPVSAAMLAAQVLLRSPERLDPRRELGVRIKRNLDRIEHMIRDILDASRVQAGQPLPLRLEGCELTTIVADVVEELNDLHADRVRLDAVEEVHGIWSADELRRAVWNLATNGIKYGAPHSPVTIAIRRVEGRARISVHNEGAPLSPDDRRRLFEPFARARSAEASSQVGWGLGLTLVRGCVEAHGGQVSVESGVEEGTTFTIEVPLDSRPFQPRASSPEALTPPSTVVAGAR